MRIDWPGPEKPADQPICGFMNELCPKDDTHITSMVVAGVLALTLFCASVITMSIYRKWKIELEIEGLLWKIDSIEIKGYFNNDIVSSPSKVSINCTYCTSEKLNTDIKTTFFCRLAAESSQCSIVWITMFEPSIYGNRTISWCCCSHKRIKICA